MVLEFIIMISLDSLDSWINTWKSFLIGLLSPILFSLICNWQNILNILKDWETLFGSLIGALLPVLIVILWNPVKIKVENYRLLKESLREIEIDTTQILNDIHNIKVEYVLLIALINDLIKKSENDKNNVPLFFNLPSKVPIYHNSSLTKLKTESPFMHNMLIALDVWIRNANAQLDSITNSLNEIKTYFSNRFNGLPNPTPRKLFTSIRDNYILELNRISKDLENILLEMLDNGIECTLTVKLTGQKMIEWNKSFTFSNYLKKFDKEYRDFRTAETNFSSIQQINENILPLISKSVDTEKEKFAQIVNEAIKDTLQKNKL